MDEMGSGESGEWLVDYMDEIEATAGFLWPHQILGDDTVSSNDLGFGKTTKGEENCDDSCLKKRGRLKSCATLGKACREKMRRDKLNDRFFELCSFLEPEKPPKIDKMYILSDATRHLISLRCEAQKLKETNDELQNTIKNLKAEKMELREEKVKLKAKKEQMDKVLKEMNMPSPFMPHFAYLTPGTGFALNNKAVSYCMNFTPRMAMSQWISPASLDTSQDHILRPPVA
ncbi:hypothetical protein Syun_000455 [Stephania yunnanensis]|uniref:BHLH domain-containing protein n=1 Tax=Stephania yunnanensis TaxID=152371 RepID=A0AAP0LET4_9MAGN